uniref:NADH-ubiquinone oxidoreductase chain 2 n=1 Tax=Agelasta perplexa TaxID=2784381 RepID=A0A7S6XWX0_9CUCU|nr:NADH dehydrogenase subunit 2 [Agelasta perplexa]QOW83738.1 NADH dehydrogenase subunit 2 [Agelasta perplexa]
MFKFYKLIFFLSMIFGSLITISSYSWLSMWMGLEINLLSIIPLLSDIKNLYPSESALKYFITQALASGILLFSMILSLNLNDFILSNESVSMILNSALLTKIGAAPFHAWFPEVMEGLNWMNGLIMLTWQKIAPMMIIFLISSLTNFILMIILISTIISGILGLNQISMRKIMTYSSINHISWMLASMLNFQNIWTFYFMIYSIISINIVLILNQMQIYYLNQFTNSLNFNKKFKFFFILNFLSLGGLPPFLGFLPKWLVINNLVQNNFFLLSFILITFTLITLFFYLRITFSTLMIYSSESLIYINKSQNMIIILFNFISLAGLLACTLMLNFS